LSKCKLIQSRFTHDMTYQPVIRWEVSGW